MLERHENGGYGNKRHSYHFDSMDELGQYLIDKAPTWSSRSSTRPSYGYDWDLGAEYDDCVRMAKDGWLEGANRVGEALQALPLRSAAPYTKIDFAGHLPHMARYCAGEPAHMIRHCRDGREGAKQILTIYVPINAASRVDASCMANFGIGLAQYVNQMEVYGHRVELYGMMTTEMTDGLVTHTWLIKGAQQFLDLPVIAFCVGHPGMFRRLGFALYERCASPQTPGYGYPKNSKLEYAINAPNGAYVLNGMNRANEVAPTPEKAYAYISKQLNAAFDIPDADAVED